MLKECKFSETFIAYDKLEKDSLVNDDLLKEVILDDYKNRKDDNPDIKITHNKHIGWVTNLVMEQFKLIKPDYQGLSSHSIFANVEMPGESSQRRNHYYRSDLSKSPVMVATYFINGSGFLIIENDDPPMLDRTYDHIIKPRTWAAYNSHLESYRTTNKEKEPRCSITALMYYI